MLVLLQAQGLVKSFGGVMALDGIDLAVESGELKCIIGPNGAGKSTLFNLLTGYLPANAGTVHFKGENITGLPPRRVCRKGIGRAFQVSRVFGRMTVFENLQAALFSRYGKIYDFFSKVPPLFRDEVFRMLDVVGLREVAHATAGTLSRGDQKRLDIAIALAHAPELLILDEPTAGMSPEETTATAELMRRLVDDGLATILFSEHNLDVVFIADRVTVMHNTKVVFEGTPNEAKHDERVQRVYLGEAL